MPEGLLARTGPGWTLATYAAPDPSQPDQNLDAVLLVSPDGVVFQVALLTPDQLASGGAATVAPRCSYGPGCPARRLPRWRCRPSIPGRPGRGPS